VVHAAFPAVLAFQSTLPVRGATRSGGYKFWWVGFQSTLPVRGATPGDAHQFADPRVSIHAPGEGSDLPEQTDPAWPKAVSIHAPGEGSDLHPGTAYRLEGVFQSTLPVRGATVSGAAD